MSKTKKKPKKSTARKSKPSRKAKAATEAVTQVIVEQSVLARMGAECVKLLERREKLDTEIDLITGQRKALMDDRCQVQNTLDEHYQEMARVAAGQQPETLFSEASMRANQQPQQQTAASPAESTSPQPPKSAAKLTEMQQQDAFDAMTLADLGITGTLAEKLEANGIRNGKELRTWRQDDFRQKIPGIGQAALEKLDDKMQAWWMQQPKAPPVETKPEPEEKSKAVEVDDVLTEEAETILEVGNKLTVNRAPVKDGRLAFGVTIALTEAARISGWRTDLLFPADEVKECDAAALSYARSVLDRIVKEADGDKEVEVAAAGLWPEISRRERELDGEQRAAE